MLLGLIVTSGGCNYLVALGTNTEATVLMTTKWISQSRSWISMNVSYHGTLYAQWRRQCRPCELFVLQSVIMKVLSYNSVSEFFRMVDTWPSSDQWSMKVTVKFVGHDTKFAQVLVDFSLGSGKNSTDIYGFHKHWSCHMKKHACYLIGSEMARRAPDPARPMFGGLVRLVLEVVSGPLVSRDSIGSMVMFFHFCVFMYSWSRDNRCRVSRHTILTFIE